MFQNFSEKRVYTLNTNKHEIKIDIINYHVGLLNVRLRVCCFSEQEILKISSQERFLSSRRFQNTCA